MPASDAETIIATKGRSHFLGRSDATYITMDSKNAYVQRSTTDCPPPPPSALHTLPRSLPSTSSRAAQVRPRAGRRTGRVQAECRTPHQTPANAFCRYLERATVIGPDRYLAAARHTGVYCRFGRVLRRLRIFLVLRSST